MSKFTAGGKPVMLLSVLIAALRGALETHGDMPVGNREPVGGTQPVVAIIVEEQTLYDDDAKHEVGKVLVIETYEEEYLSQPA